MERDSCWDTVAKPWEAKQNLIDKICIVDEKASCHWPDCAAHTMRGGLGFCPEFPQQPPEVGTKFAELYFRHGLAGARGSSSMQSLNIPGETKADCCPLISSEVARIICTGEKSDLLMMRWFKSFNAIASIIWFISKWLSCLRLSRQPLSDRWHFLCQTVGHPDPPDENVHAGNVM